MRRTRALTALLVAFIVALVTACGGNGGDDGTSGGDGGSGELEGKITVRFMGDPQPIYDTFAKEFMEQNPGTTVEVQLSPWAEAHDQFTTEISAGSVVDVAEMGNTWTPEFAALGALEPLDVSAEEYVKGMVQAATVDGEVYGAPWYAGARGLVYRKDLFKQAGIAEPPGTWEELEAAAEKLKAKFNNKPYAFGVAARDTHAFLGLVWQNGGSFGEGQGEDFTSHLDEPKAVDAFNWWKGLYEAGYSPEDSLTWNSLGSRESFANGQIAMAYLGGWDVFALLGDNPDLEGKIGTALMPAGPAGNRDTFAGGSHLVVFKESDNKPLAKAFIEFMMKPENVSRYAENVPGYFPGNAEGITATAEKLGPLYEPFATMLLEHTRSYPLGAGWGAMEGAEAFDNTMQAVVGGQQPTKEALTELAAMMEEEYAD